MQDGERELCRRRERAKAAQRAYRQRQAEAVLELREEHERLKRLVVEIVNAARIDDPVQLNVAITRAKSALDLDATPSTETESSEIWSSYNAVPRAVALSDMHTPQNFSQPRVCSNEAPARYHLSGHMSPRFDYGLWIDPDRFLKIYEPPIDIAPYIGAGRHTIGGHIAWACLDYGYWCLQDAMEKQISTEVTSSGSSGIQPNQDPGDDYPEVLPPNSAARRLFDISLRHSKPLHDVAYIAALLEARMQFRRLGYMRKDNPGADSVSQQQLQSRVFEGFRKKGVCMDQWWSALDIERHIGHKIGVYQFSAFQTALYCGKEAETQLLRPLARRLAQQSVCFGDGPRWRADHATMTVNAWVPTVLEQMGNKVVNTVLDTTDTSH